MISLMIGRSKTHLHNAIISYGLIALISLCMIGCSANVEEEVQLFIDTIKKYPVENFKSIPDPNPIESITYQAAHLKNPFDTSSFEQSEQPSGGSPAFDRYKEPLESYPLDSLKMVGYLKKESTYFALIRDPNGTIHKASVGNYLGQHNAAIQAIDDQGLEVIEKNCTNDELCSSKSFHLSLSNG